MPVTTSRSGLQVQIHGIQVIVDSPELIQALGTHLATILYKNANKDTGAMAAALGHVGKPERIANGWAIGVGDPDKVGKKDQSAPSHTLRDFFNYLADSGIGVHPSDWAGLSEEHKQLLAQMRRGGQFGGRGPDYANYMWVQNYGNAKARVPARYFLEESIAEWRADVPAMVKEFSRAQKP